MFRFSSVQFSCSDMSDSLRPNGLQHAKPPCPSPTPRVYSNACPLNQWCHPTISSSVTPLEGVTAFNHSQHQRCFKWVSSSHDVAKECSNYYTTALISHTNKVILKILQDRLQQYMNHELPDVQLDLEKAEEPEIKLPTSVGSSEKQENSRKTSTFALLTMSKPLTVWIPINCGKFFKRWEYQTTWSASWETCMQVRKQQLELHLEQQTGSK